MMYLFYLLASLLASGEVIAIPTSASNLDISGNTPSASSDLPSAQYNATRAKLNDLELTRKSRTSQPTGNFSLEDGLFDPPTPNYNLTDGSAVFAGIPSCWRPPSAPSVASNSTDYSKGTCLVCVSQSLPDPNIHMPTIGTVHDFELNFRDNDNHDMGAANQTLAAFGGETGGRNTSVTITVGGKPFHLWTMRDHKDVTYVTVYMDFNGPGPADPFWVPSMMFDSVPSDDAVFNDHDCYWSGVSPNGTRVYFTCSFTC